MVNALVSLSENANRVLNVVKAKYCLADKAAAIEFVIGKYIESEDDPELRPEFIRKIQKAEKGKFIRVDDFAARYGLKDVPSRGREGRR
jgi:hypothetical protein